MRCAVCRAPCVKCKGGKCKCGMNEQQATISNQWHKEGLDEGGAPRILPLLAMSGYGYEEGKEVLLSGITEDQALQIRLTHMDKKVVRTKKCKYGRRIMGNVYKKCQVCGQPYNTTGGICKDIKK